MPDELTASPEADARIAEAMGWTRDVSGLVWLDADGNDTGWSCHAVDSHDGNKTHPAFRPTSTGDGMLVMLEWMDRQGWFWKLTNSPRGCTVFMSPGKQTPYIIADNGPLAVAKAMLAAMAATEEPT